MNAEAKSAVRSVYGTLLFVGAVAVAILPFARAFLSFDALNWTIWITPALFFLLGLQWIIWPQTQLVMPHLVARLFGAVLVVGATFHLLFGVFMTCCFVT